MPDGLDFRKTETLGLQLVNLLAKQLKGTVSFDRGQKGLLASVSFPDTAVQYAFPQSRPSGDPRQGCAVG
jgi:two-component sensor histidine kinase